MPDKEQNGDSEKRDELIFELIKRRFDGEVTRSTALDTKAGSLVGFMSIVVVLLIGAANLITEEGRLEWSAHLTPGNDQVIAGEANMTSGSKGIFRLEVVDSKSGLYFSGIALLLVSIGLALYALKVRKGYAVPDVEVLIKEFINLSYGTVLKRNGAEMAWVVKYIEKQNNFKAKLIEYSWILLIAGLITTFVSVVYPTSLAG